MDEHIQKAIEIVREGGVIIFPTDTAFGIGCRMDDEAAVARVFSIRRRPENKATPVLIDTVLMAKQYVTDIPQDVLNTLIEPYWPGALTIVLPCKTEKVPSLVRGGGLTIGLRIPNHEIPRTIIREVGVPLIGPSANISGEQTPYLFADIDPRLHSLVDYIVPGVCRVGLASTVVDCSVQPWKVIREGKIKIPHE